MLTEVIDKRGHTHLFIESLNNTFANFENDMFKMGAHCSVNHENDAYLSFSQD